jgi:hypothetical protein
MPAVLFSYSLSAATDPPSATGVKRIIVWDGEGASVGAGWVNPTTSSIQPQTAVAHSGTTALELKFKGSKEWIVIGWNWFKFKTGTGVGTDTSAMRNLIFWIRTQGDFGGTLRVNLLCNGDKLDTPEEHTLKVEVLKYCPKLFDGAWHEVVIPLADLYQIKGLNPKILSEIHFGLTAEKAVDGSIFVDDIGFDDRGVSGSSTTQGASRQ